MILQGRLTADPELKTTPNGVEVANFTVAWSKKYKETESQCFLNCIAWRATGAFVAKYFTKGQEIAIEGELTSRSYEDKQGNKRTAFELTCEQIHFCGSKSDTVKPNTTTNTKPDTNVTAPDFQEIDMDDNDLPF